MYFLKCFEREILDKATELTITIIKYPNITHCILHVECRARYDKIFDIFKDGNSSHKKIKILFLTYCTVSNFVHQLLIVNLRN
jgi:hypothetical protein